MILIVGSLFKGISKFTGKMLLTRYDTEEELRRKSEQMMNKIKLNASERVLEKVRKDFSMLEEGDDDASVPTSN